MRFGSQVILLLVASSCGAELVEVQGSAIDEQTAEAELVRVLAVSPKVSQLQAGGRASAAIGISTTGTWTLSVSALGNGVSAALSSPTLVKGRPVTLTLEAAAAASAGTQSFVVTAKSGSATRTFTGSVTVSVATAGAPHVFVIAMENKSSTSIYGNVNASFLNALKAQYGTAQNYRDVLSSSVPSEPHYIWLEAGTNAFADRTFTGDADATATNSTADTNHLVTRLTATTSKTWRTYQEGMTAGTCPTRSVPTTFYAAKHDPFVFFQDLAGACISHHRPFSAFAADLSRGDVASYTFITPNLCNDMHGAAGCTNGCTSGGSAGCIAAGDGWLRATVPPILSFLNQHRGVLLIVFDEPEGATTQPFFIAGPKIKPGFSSTVDYSHSSYLKTLELWFGLPVSPRVSAANDFSDFFEGGVFP
jgi:phosphatidylinositol-3-phosphatase